MLTKVGSQTGTNLAAAGAAGMAWLGADGQFTNEFINQSGEDLVLAIWGPAVPETFFTLKRPERAAL